MARMLRNGLGELTIRLGINLESVRASVDKLDFLLKENALKHRSEDTDTPLLQQKTLEPSQFEDAVRCHCTTTYDAANFADDLDKVSETKDRKTLLTRQNDIKLLREKLLQGCRECCPHQERRRW